ncbi:MAG: STAS domain-containing protein [Verrucomicrobiota bacterium]|jgi:anti-anti-sigma factor|nr:STAS domain-containing protein [Verrucomicrobiota bacterium]MDD8047567.1 STAS domain-containing protein [Verrucomicrobiota bacterium]MDD8050737.1 STAS domain-containing protein [Verrucomicrobiota bacterium]MDI9382694.1 STAS domain-containing protein [Verrucomicrobiota bacterium]HCF96849.1 hypothetical protein [Verrucomicrobiota bacterium]
MNLYFLLEDSGHRRVITIDVASIDEHNVHLVQAELLPLLDDFSEVVLDLHAIGFMSSSGIGLLLRCLQTMKAKGGELSLRRPSPKVRVLFDIIGLERVLPIEDQPEAE